MALKEPSRTVKSAQTTFEIIDFIHEQDGAEIEELADYLGLAKSTVYGYLATLESLEYLVCDGGTYHLGLKFLYHGIAAKNSLPITHIAGETLRSLAERTSLAAWLIAEEHGRAVYVDQETPVDGQQTYGRVSKRTNLHVLAGGKAILAHLPQTRVDSILEHYGLDAQTEYTITDEAELRDELATIRELGYAVSKHEAALGIWSVGAPVLFEGDVLGALSVSGTSSQIDDDSLEDLGATVSAAADELAERYGRLYS